MPTRTGYSFVGWSGKNILSLYSLINCTYDSEDKSFTLAGVTWKLNSKGELYIDGASDASSWSYTYQQSLSVLSGRTYRFWTRLSTDRIQCVFKVVKKDGTESTGIDGNRPFDSYTCDGTERSVSVYLQAARGITFNNESVEPMLEIDYKTQYEPPRTVTADTQKTSQEDETLHAIWKKNLFVASNIVSRLNGCNWNDTTKTLTFANSSSLDTRNSYNAFVFIQRISFDDIAEGYDWSISIAPPLVVGKVYSNSFIKLSQYKCMEIRANGPYADSSICFDMSSFADVEYIVRFKCIASTVSTVNAAHNENFTIQDLEIFEA